MVRLMLTDELGLLADIIISKYGDSMQLYRQNQHFKRMDNVDIPESTLCD